MKFIHAADLHIDSPLVGLCCYEGAPTERLREATRRALENLVALAIEETVAFVIIAGDLFDGPWRNMHTGLFTARQFRRLEDAEIGVYLVRGNHDAESQVRQKIKWPGNVHEFSVHRAETICLEGIAVALHGRGFAHPQVTDDPVPKYPSPVPGMFNIGVLHTNVDGSQGHDPYAPTVAPPWKERATTTGPWDISICAKRSSTAPISPIPATPKDETCVRRGRKGACWFRSRTASLFAWNSVPRTLSAGIGPGSR